MSSLVVLLATLFLASPAMASTALPQDNSKAVILAYHRVGEDHIPDQNLTLEQFQTHIEEIKKGHYNVQPLSTIIDALKSNATLPPRTIVITFEGAYRSTIENAAPILLKNKIPFTVIYASDPLDQKDPEFTDWKSLKSLRKSGLVEIATLPASYTHTAHQDTQTMLGSLNKARQRYREEFGHEAAILSYPFGEYSAELKTLAGTQGFSAALGLHSGAAYAGDDLFALPRFSLTESYGDLERFRMISNAHPLPVTDTEPEDPLLNETAFQAGFTLPAALTEEAETLSCFISGQGKAQLEILGNRVEIRSTETLFDQERIRLNCTMPAPQSENDEEQWRWLGMLYHRNFAKSPEPDEPQQPQE